MWKNSKPQIKFLFYLCNIRMELSNKFHFSTNLNQSYNFKPSYKIFSSCIKYQEQFYLRVLLTNQKVIWSKNSQMAIGGRTSLYFLNWNKNQLGIKGFTLIGDCRLVRVIIYKLKNLLYLVTNFCKLFFTKWEVKLVLRPFLIAKFN